MEKDSKKYPHWGTALQLLLLLPEEALLRQRLLARRPWRGSEDELACADDHV